MGVYVIRQVDWHNDEEGDVLAEIVVDAKNTSQVRKVRGTGEIADMLRDDAAKGLDTWHLLGGFGAQSVEFIEDDPEDDDEPIIKAEWRMVNTLDGSVAGVVETNPDPDNPVLTGFQGPNPPIGFRLGLPLREYVREAREFEFQPVNDVARTPELADVIRATGEAIARVVEAHGVISKMDEERHHIFGWAYVTHDKDGNVVVDKSGEFVDDYEEIEKAAYHFVVNSRAGDMDHTNLKSAEMIESMVFTPEKIEKMNLPAGSVPTGWWVGFHIPDDDDWEEAKKRKAFSVHGKGMKKAV